MTGKHIGRVPKFKFVLPKRLSLDSRKHQYYCAHWRKERARNLSELADLLLELEVLCLIFNKPVSDLHCKKEMCVSHACICLMHLQKRATKMHALYNKRAQAYASDATPKLQGCSGCRQPLLYLAQRKVTSNVSGCAILRTLCNKKIQRERRLVAFWCHQVSVKAF